MPRPLTVSRYPLAVRGRYAAGQPSRKRRTSRSDVRLDELVAELTSGVEIGSESVELHHVRICRLYSRRDECEHLAPVGAYVELTERRMRFAKAWFNVPVIVSGAGQPANEPCVNASPASAYWGYWLAAPGGAWCYSTLGAGFRRSPGQLLRRPRVAHHD